MNSLHLRPSLAKRALTALIPIALAQSSFGAITVTFEETGGNVVATISGSIDMVGLNHFDINYAGDRGSANFSNTQFSQLGNTGDGLAMDEYTNGDFFASGLATIAPTSSTIVDSLGSNNGSFYVNSDVPANGVFTPAPGQTSTWASTNLASLGLGGLSSTPLTVWNNPNASGTDGAFQFVTVPEPSSALLCGLSALGLIRRRR